MVNCSFILWFPLNQTKLAFRSLNNHYGNTLRIPSHSYCIHCFVVQQKKRNKCVSLSELFMCSSFENRKQRLWSYSAQAPKFVSPSIAYDNLLENITQVGEEIKTGECRIGRIVRITKEGLFIDLGVKKAAFLPRKELWHEHNNFSLEQYKEGEELEVEIQQRKDNFELVVSEVSVRRRKCWEQLKEYYVNSKNFFVLVIGYRNSGLIVRYDCIEGYLPIEHLIPSQTVSQVMSTELEVRVLSLEAESNNLVVSQRLTVAEKREKELKVGSVVKGVVRAVRDYGVIVDLFGVLGLLFIKDISYEHVENPFSIFTVGETIQCMVIQMDRKRHRVILSTKALELESGEMLRDKTKVFERKAKALVRVRKILDERSSKRKCFFGKAFPVNMNKE